MTNINDLGLPAALPEMLPSQVNRAVREAQDSMRRYYNETNRVAREMTAADLGLPLLKEWDGRSVGESAPHAAYCDIALQDSMVEITDGAERIWSYDDELFNKSLAANGFKIVRMADAPYSFWLGADHG